jgi:hypothetical protein
MRARVATLIGVTLGALLTGGSARAEEPLKDDPRARQFFEVGAQAYTKGQYLLAIDAFKEAYKLTERPGILFSLAQAHQRQFRATGDEQHLALAIDHYRRYLARVPSGGRSAEAAASLDTLLKLLERLRPRASGRERGHVLGRLLLSSPTPGAELSVNGEPVESLPTALELPADKYRVSARAPGFEPTSQEVLVVEGSSVPLNHELRPLPSTIRLSGSPGAEVFVDGRSVGWLPVADLALPAGEHWVGAREPGRRTKTELVRLERGQSAEVDLRLETTPRRQAAWIAGGAAVAGLAVTVPLAVLALVRDGEAADLEARRREGSLTASEAQRLNSALDARNELRTGAIAAGVASGALLASALVLYFGDTPAPPAAGPAPGATPTSSPPARLEPMLLGGLGVRAVGSF